MYISVLSGKGGTGKTTISTNLASYLAQKGYKTRYLDFDVEEPNGFIFLKPDVSETEEVKVKVPKVDEDLCKHCGACANHCNFNALAVTKQKVLVFEKLCHSCGLCSVVCPVDAIEEVDREIGKIEIGKMNNLEAIRGVLNIGEPMGIPIIKQLREHVSDDYINIVDSPPGSSCSVVNSVEDSDYSILVTEPTEFGLHDLRIAVEVIKQMNIPFGVVINKSDENDDIIEDYCKEEGCEILGKIPFSKDIASKYSKGQLLFHENDKVAEEMDKIVSKVLGGSQNEANSCY
ncbi:ATP-binding protein [Caldisalinibacter kiritimatiensis]|uniref:CobQ/CobB/MinD/ParA family protein n=1 Tax=Caldisalinibacter kiritimatiensis TaxID=1304284 RepID=R1CRQ3_9FIRM|nr:ATP-binding protein [Caldisalinibacter kiritimatiensis]EOD01356.1 CobQ/CobB/MinD/ParA family protein [Caldisalinibacter kiritimatiensis]